LTVLAAVVWKVEFASGDLNRLRDLEDHTLFSAARAPEARDLQLSRHGASPE
jgi:hypothetical protein